MSSLNATATVSLHANGQQVADTLNLLKQRAFDLENAIAKAAAAGNKASLKKLQKELTITRRQIREMTSSAEQAEQVLKRLDRATPKELRETLRVLNKQLEGIERGTEVSDKPPDNRAGHWAWLACGLALLLILAFFFIRFAKPHTFFSK